MILISNKIKPSYVENTYWADLSENQYGGILKYYNGLTNNWEYIEEPIFQQHPAYNIITEHVQLLDELIDEFGYYHTIETIQNQLDRLQEDKADIADVYTQEDIDAKLQDINDRITELDVSSDTSVKDIYAKIDAGDKLNQTQIDELREESQKHVLKKEGWDLIEVSERERLKTLHNYDDTTIKNALKLTATKTYVDNSIEQLIGGSPQVLDTLKELADALGNDPNFATTITNLIATKADLSYLTNEYYNKEDVNNLLTNFISDIPTVTSVATGVVTSLVPEWSRQDTKPTYTYTEVGALPADTFIPSKTTDLTNDASFVTAQQLQDALDNFEPIPEDILQKLRFTESYCSYTLNGQESLTLNSDYYIHEIIVDDSHITTTILYFNKDVPIGRQHIILINSNKECNFQIQSSASSNIEINAEIGITRLDLLRVPTNQTIVSSSNETIATDTNDNIIATTDDATWLLFYHDDSDINSANERLDQLEQTKVDNDVVEELAANAIPDIVELNPTMYTDVDGIVNVPANKNGVYKVTIPDNVTENFYIVFNNNISINKEIQIYVYTTTNTNCNVVLNSLDGITPVGNFDIMYDEDSVAVSGDYSNILEINIKTVHSYASADKIVALVVNKLWEVQA